MCREGRVAEGSARPGKQAAETGGRQRRRKQTEKAEQLTRHRKKTDYRIFSLQEKGRDADTLSFLYLHFFPQHVLLFATKPSFFYCFELAKRIAQSQ